MDTNWCLSCGQHTENDMIYCSKFCKDKESFDDYESDEDQIVPILPVSSFAESICSSSNFTGRDPEGIKAWAAQIPPTKQSSIHPPSMNPSRSVSSSSSCSSLRPPKLLLPHRRALPPSLSISTPQAGPAGPSMPIEAPLQHLGRAVLSGGESMVSLLTESIGTPVSGVGFPDRSGIRSHTLPPKATPHAQTSSSLLSHIASQMRNWVGTPKSQPRVPPPNQSTKPKPLFIFGLDEDDDISPFLHPPEAKGRYTHDAKLAANLVPSVHKIQFPYGDESVHSVIEPLVRCTERITDFTPTPEFVHFSDDELSSSVLDLLVDDFYHPTVCQERR